MLRTWYRQRGENARQLIVPTFIIGDPWLTVNTASVLLLFQHGADSPGIARPEDWERVSRLSLRGSGDRR